MLLQGKGEDVGIKGELNMDILIKNMEMPKSCEKCPLKCVVKSNPMIITNKGVSRLTKEKDCPLIPVPEHGDLVQLDDALDCFSEDDVVARKALRKIPVVLERTI